MEETSIIIGRIELLEMLGSVKYCTLITALNACSQACDVRLDYERQHPLTDDGDLAELNCPISKGKTCYENYKQEYFNMQAQWVRADIPTHLKKIKYWLIDNIDESRKKSVKIVVTRTLKVLYRLGELLKFAVVKEWPNYEKIKTMIDELNQTLESFKDYKQKKPPINEIHFNSGDTKEHLTTIFERLQNNGYFDEKANLDMWLYICGVAPLQSEFEPLNWVKDNALLAHLIDSLFVNDYNKWAIGVQCFTVKGEQPKVGTLKQSISNGVKSENKKHNKLENMLR